MQVNSEDYIDRATAITGAGPAYVALFAESLLGIFYYVRCFRKIRFFKIIS